MKVKNISEMTGYELREAVESIKVQLKTGRISYESAKEATRLIIDEMNSRIVNISKINKKRAYKVSFTSLMR